MCICYGICIFIFVLRQTDFNMISTILNAITSLMHGATLAIVVLLLIVDTNKISLKIATITIAIAGIIVLNIVKNDASTDLLYLTLFMVAMRNVESEKIYRYYFIYAGSALLMILLLYNTGIIQDTVLRGRHYLGFKYSSFSSNYLLHIAIAFLAWRGEKIKLWQWIIIEGINYYLWVMTNTNSVFIIILALPVLFYMIRWYQKKRDIFDIKIFNFLVKYAFVLFALFTILVQILYHFNATNEFFVKLNYLLSLRLSLTDRAFQIYPITLFGQAITWSTWTSSLTTLSNYFYVDSSYLQIILQFGIIIFILVGLCFIYIGKYMVKCKNCYPAIALIVFLLHCITDPQLLSFRYDFFLIILIGAYKRIGFRGAD